MDPYRGAMANLEPGPGAAAAAVVRLCHDLANATSLEGMFDSVVQALVEATGLRRASVLTFDEAGVMRFRASRGLSAGYRAAVDGHSPWTADTVDAQPILVADVAQDPSLASLLPVFASEEIRALAFLPLHGGGRLLGKFMLYSGAPMDWSSRDLGFAGAAADLLASFLLRELAQGRLLQARKMESLGLLAGGIAHDFNNLLTSILGYVDMIRHDTLRGTPARTYADELLQAVEQAGELTRQLLGFARPQPVAKEAIDLGAFVAEAKGPLHRLCGPRHALQLRFGEGLQLVHANRAQLHQLLWNLVTNARDAMPEGGEIQVAVRRSRLPNCVELEVRDAGVGMDEAVRRRVFEPLFTTKVVGRGTGLGLATCYAIVTSLGGDISVRSSPGHGSTFVVALPSAGSATVPAAPPEVFVGTVLLVDDQEHVLRALQRSLQAARYRVLTAVDGQQALDVLGRDVVDIVVSDVVMPVLSGVELAERVHRRWPGLPLLLITGFVDEHHELPAHLPVLGKPFLPRELLQRIETLLPRGGRATQAGAVDQTLSGS